MVRSHLRHKIAKLGSCVPLAAVAGAMLLSLAASQSKAQTVTVLHTFTGVDGCRPQAGLAHDDAGNLYGTTELGGAKVGDRTMVEIHPGATGNADIDGRRGRDCRRHVGIRRGDGVVRGATYRLLQKCATGRRTGVGKGFGVTGLSVEL